MNQSKFPLVVQVLKTPKIREKLKYKPIMKQFAIQRTGPMQLNMVAMVAGGSEVYIPRLLFDDILIRDHKDATATVMCLDASDQEHYFSAIPVSHGCVCSCTCQDFFWNQKRYQDRLLQAKKDNIEFTEPPFVCKHIAGVVASLLQSKVLSPIS